MENQMGHHWKNNQRFKREPFKIDCTKPHFSVQVGSLLFKLGTAAADTAQINWTVYFWPDRTPTQSDARIHTWLLACRHTAHRIKLSFAAGRADNTLFCVVFSPSFQNQSTLWRAIGTKCQVRNPARWDFWNQRVQHQLGIGYPRP